MKFYKLLRSFNHTCQQILLNQMRRNSHIYVTSSHRRCSLKKGVLKKFQRKTSVLKSLFNKIADLQACNLLIKRDSTKDIFCKICQIFQKTYFGERLRMTASKLLFRVKPHWLIKIRYFKNTFQKTEAAV